MLSSIAYFSGVDSKVLEAISRTALRRKYEAGQTVFLEGQPSAGLLVVEEGHLKSAKLSTGGREPVIRVVGPGDVFNGISVLASETNSGTVIALESATVWIIGRESLLRVLDEYPALAGIIIQALAARIGTVTDVLNRALRRMAENGLIEVEREQIRILDPDSLAGLAHPEL